MNLSKASINLVGFLTVCVLLALNSNTIKKAPKEKNTSHNVNKKEHILNNVNFLIPVTELSYNEKTALTEPSIPGR